MRLLIRVMRDMLQIIRALPPQQTPVTASLVQIITVLGRVNTPEVKPFGLRGFMLLDGYCRAVRFWAKNDPAATLAVYVSTEV